MAVTWKRLVLGVLLAALLAGMFLVPGTPLASRTVERLSNGCFESGFHGTEFGSVGDGWDWFFTGGHANVSFFADDWSAVVADGHYSQLIGLNTYDVGATEQDISAGIYQTVAVQPGATYELSLRGMIRAEADDPDRTGYNYRVRYGVDQTGSGDWRAVQEWIELPWDAVYPTLSPGAMLSYSAQITATGDRLTVFIGLLKKWATSGREVMANVDAISLKGAMPADVDEPGASQAYTIVTAENGQYVVVEQVAAHAAGLRVSFTPPQFPTAGWGYTIDVNSSNDVGVTSLELYDNDHLVGAVEDDVGRLILNHSFVWQPSGAGKHTLKAVAYDVVNARATYQADLVVGALGQFLTNGGFEAGFLPGPAGEVGAGWGSFHTGGGAAYGFYDDVWPPVVYAGDHSQLIEINTFYGDPPQADRYAGIYQSVKGLTVGATYKLQLHGMLRAVAGDPDRQGYAYRVQWGYLAGKSTDWTAVTNWDELPWNTAYDRLDPGAFNSYTAAFVAPKSDVTIFVRAWKKWATPNRELDVNLDGISLSGYVSPQ